MAWFSEGIGMRLSRQDQKRLIRKIRILPLISNNKFCSSPLLSDPLSNPMVPAMKIRIKTEPDPFQSGFQPVLKMLRFTGR